MRPCDKENEEIKVIKRSQTEMLERISGFTAEEAKAYLIAQVEAEVTHETALKIKEVESRMKEECEARAREVVAQAIQRCAADQVAEMTVSVVPLPNDEMKGRIIGREGRNIRTIETLTGVDLIIDDTPGGHHRLLLRAGAAGDRPPGPGEADRRRPHPSHPHRGDGGEGPPGGGRPPSRQRASAPCSSAACGTCTRSW